MVYILHNPLSGGANFEEAEGKIKEQAELEGQTFEVKDITKIEDMVGFFKGLAEDDRVVILGGDGTLNHLANDIRGYQPKNPLYVYSGGTGNDYIRDIRKEGEEEKCLFQINEDIINLPVVVIDGKAYSFLNNVSYGLDGEVCVVGEDQKAAGAEKVNYTSIAIKLLMSYKTCGAHIKVDGQEYDFKKVWIAPAMNGRFCGGGMMVSPKQDRKTGNISTTVFFGSGRIRTLMIFPKIFTGEHVNYKKFIREMEGQEIEVTMEVPKHVHIDGEVVRDVKSMVAYKGEKAHAYDKYTPDGEVK